LRGAWAQDRGREGGAQARELALLFSEDRLASTQRVVLRALDLDIGPRHELSLILHANASLDDLVWSTGAATILWRL